MIKWAQILATVTVCLQLTACKSLPTNAPPRNFKVTAAGHDASGDFCAAFRLSNTQATTFFERAKLQTAAE